MKLQIEKQKLHENEIYVLPTIFISKYNMLMGTKTLATIGWLKWYLDIIILK